MASLSELLLHRCECRLADKWGQDIFCHNPFRWRITYNATLKFARPLAPGLFSDEQLVGKNIPDSFRVPRLAVEPCDSFPVKSFSDRSCPLSMTGEPKYSPNAFRLALGTDDVSHSITREKLLFPMLQKATLAPVHGDQQSA